MSYVKGFTGLEPLPKHVEVGVGHEASHLDQGVVHQIEPGHLAVDPHQALGHGRHPIRPAERGSARRDYRQMVRSCLSPPAVQEFDPE